MARSGEPDRGTVRHQGSSTKHRAQLAAPSKKTPLNGAGDTSAARQNLAAHYEHLRRDDTRRTGGGSLGLALFLRRGMTAWMQACSECVAVAAEPCSLSDGQKTIPEEMRSQLTTLLAGMILSQQQEVTP